MGSLGFVSRHPLSNSYLGPDYRFLSFSDRLSLQRYIDQQKPSLKAKDVQREGTLCSNCFDDFIISFINKGDTLESSDKLQDSSTNSRPIVPHTDTFCCHLRETSSLTTNSDTTSHDTDCQNDDEMGWDNAKSFSYWFQRLGTLNQHHFGYLGKNFGRKRYGIVESYGTFVPVQARRYDCTFEITGFPKEIYAILRPCSPLEGESHFWLIGLCHIWSGDLTPRSKFCQKSLSKMDITLC